MLLTAMAGEELQGPDGPDGALLPRDPIAQQLQMAEVVCTYLRV